MVKGILLWIGAVIAVIAVWLVIAVSVWGWGVATAGIYGRGEAHKQIESATNRIEKQQLFEQDIADVNKFVEQIRSYAPTVSSYATQIAGQPDDAIGSHSTELSRRQQNLAAMKLQCINTVENYNAEARKVSSEQFRAADLPEHLPVPPECQ